MHGFERELRAAIERRNDAAVELAYWLLSLASDDGGGHTPTWCMTYMLKDEPDRLLADVRALSAVIFNRAGMPWDAIAAMVDCSKQALHRRFAARGEGLFDEAVEGIREAEVTALELGLPSEVEWHMRSFPSPEDISTAGSQLASNLVRFRKVPRWWWYDPRELDST